MTAFVVESYKKLQPNSDDLTAALLYRISGQLGINDTFYVPPASLIPRISSNPPASVVFYNICWFVSLILSICCALGAILVRQWVTTYIQRPRDETHLHDRARTRHLLFQNIEKWKFAAVINALPFALHASVFLFLAGVVAFTFQTNIALAIVTSVFFGIGVLGYTVLTALPLWDPSCPYQTPLSSMMLFLSVIYKSMFRHLFMITWSASPPSNHDLDVQIIKWLRSRLATPDEIVTLIGAVPDFVESFPENPAASLQTAQKIVIDAIGTDITSLLLSCHTFYKPPIRSQFRETSQAAASASTRALCSLAARASQHPAISWSDFMDVNGHDLYLDPSAPVNMINTLALRTPRILLIDLDVALQAYTFILTAVNNQMELSRSVGRIGALRKRIQNSDSPLNMASGHERYPYNSLGGLQGDIPSFFREVWLLELDDMKLDISRLLRSCGSEIPRTFRTIVDVDYLLLLREAVMIPWLCDSTLSPSQETALCATLLPIVDNARRIFIDPIGRNKWDIRWFLGELSALLKSIKADDGSLPVSLLSVLAQICAALLFPVGESRHVLQRMILEKLSSYIIRQEFQMLDMLRTCMRLLLRTMDGTPMEYYPACEAMGMLENQEDLDIIFGSWIMIWAWDRYFDGAVNYHTKHLVARALVHSWMTSAFIGKTTNDVLEQGLRSVNLETASSHRFAMRPVLHLLDSEDLITGSLPSLRGICERIKLGKTRLSLSSTSMLYLYSSNTPLPLARDRKQHKTKPMGANRWADLLAYIAEL